jgi:predicted ArsR family transcriptional regulator
VELQELPRTPPGSDAPTRERVARAILELGPSTAATLARRLDLTPAAVRRHLDHMTAEGTLEAREPRVYGSRGRGRPARVFAITEAGRDRFVQQYDDLALQALRFLRETAGNGAVMDFARRRVAGLERRYAQVAAAQPGLARSQALAQALTQDGYAASVRQGPVGEQLCQQHCPVSHVAQEFPQLCEAETEVISKVLGRHVQRLATIAHGDGVCTTCIPTMGTAQITAQTTTQNTSTSRTSDTHQERLTS